MTLIKGHMHNLMPTRLNNRIIFNLDTENNKAPETLLKTINDQFSGIIATGCYKGVTEQSIVVPLTEYNLRNAINIASIYSQESILVVENDNAYLLYLKSGERVTIGQYLVLVNKDYALKQDAFTLINNTYYVIK